MVVNDMIKTFGYARNRLSHFNILLYDPITEDWITIGHPSIDDYIYLCDREVVDWMVSDIEEETVDITVYMESDDINTFRKFFHKQ